MVNDKDIRKAKDRVGVFVQARMGSSRLPGKCMITLGEKPIIDWVLEGVLQSNRIDGVVVCIPDQEIDIELAEHLIERNVDVFRGSEDDVLGRFAEASRRFPFDHIVRVTADCPFVSGEQLDVLIDYYFTHELDYGFNHIPLNNNCYPDGLGGELFSTELLLKMNKEASLASHREHLTLYIREQPQHFRIGGPTAPPSIQMPSVKLDIDTPEDFSRMARLLDELGIPPASRPSDVCICQKYLELFE